MIFKLFMLRAEEVMYRCACLMPMSTANDSQTPLVYIGTIPVENAVYAASIQKEIDAEGKFKLGMEP